MLCTTMVGLSRYLSEISKIMDPNAQMKKQKLRDAKQIM